MFRFQKALSIAALVLPFLLSGCQTGLSPEAGEVVISMADQSGRLLSPGADLDVAKVKLAFTGTSVPAPVELAPGAATGSISFLPGSYSVTADAVNSTGFKLGSGTQSFTVTAGTSTAVTVTIKPLGTTGTFKIEAKTTGLGLTAPALTAVLTPVTGTASTLNLTEASGTWSAEKSLAPGTYRLATLVKDGALSVSAGMETVHIVSGALTYGGLSLTRNADASVVSSITLDAPVVVDNYQGSQTPTAVAPTISTSPASEIYTDTEVTITMVGEAGSSIRYTLDGTAPTAASSLYTAPIKKTTAAAGQVSVKALAIVAGKDNSPVTTLTYTVKTRGQTSSYYKTNPDGQVGKYKTGMTVTCVSTKSDGFTEWTPDLLIAQGAANDDAKSFYGGHEYPSYDSYALYAAWDNTNLYLGWQFTYVNDIANPSNNGGNEAKPTNGDIPQMLLFDIDPAKASVGTMATGKNVWYDGQATAGYNLDLGMGVDKLAMFSSKGGVGTPALFSMNASGFFDYTNLSNFATLGIVYGAVDGLVPATAWGVKKYPYDVADLNGTTGWVDFVAEGHNKTYDQFYEMKIPLTALGITKTQLETNGIGVMHVSIYGVSTVDSLPKDMQTVNNAKLPYSKDSSTSNEKEDLDLLSTPLARIGKL